MLRIRISFQGFSQMFAQCLNHRRECQVCGESVRNMPEYSGYLFNPSIFHSELETEYKHWESQRGNTVVGTVSQPWVAYISVVLPSTFSGKHKASKFVCFFVYPLYVLSVNTAIYHKCWCHLHLKMPLLWTEVWALSFKRDRRQHAVWETGWKSASVNTPRPHVLPGQRGWLLSRHICTQSLSSQRASQGDRAGQRRERSREREKRSQTGRTCHFCEKKCGVRDENDDIWLFKMNK